MKKIVMTGGGTAGHVTPNIALLPNLKKSGFEISYIGSYQGMEKNLIEEQGITYYGISSGKLRRYFNLKNITDPARVVKGFFQAKKLLKNCALTLSFPKAGLFQFLSFWQQKRCAFRLSYMNPILRRAWPISFQFRQLIKFVVIFRKH